MIWPIFSCVVNSKGFVLDVESRPKSIPIYSETVWATWNKSFYKFQDGKNKPSVLPASDEQRNFARGMHLFINGKKY